jgi:hypothetical protein
MHRMADATFPARGAEHIVDMEAEPPEPRAGEPVDLMFTVRERGTGRPEITFRAVDEREMHLTVVSQDLTLFRHLHPRLEGHTFHVRHAFPEGTTYVLWAEVSSPKGERVLSRSTITVAGPPDHRPVELRDSGRKVRCDDGRHMATLYVSSLRPGEPSRLSYWLEDEKGPVTDLEPCLGARGHCIIVSEGASDLLHVHPDRNDKEGPQIVFGASFPRPGRYRLWGQFRRGGRTIVAAHAVTAR